MKETIRKNPWILAIITTTLCGVVLLLAWRGEVTLESIVSHLSTLGAGAAIAGARRKP